MRGSAIHPTWKGSQRHERAEPAMIALLYAKISNPQVIAMILVAIATAATVITIALPLVEGDVLGRRMKAVAVERDRIRARERERLNEGAKVRGARSRRST